jgi:putative ATP-dependent endonuclease of the OLD family
MKIKLLKIHNYRSICDLEMECLSLTTLIGPNNHGKSNVLSALEFALSTSFKPIEQDFFFRRDSSDNQLWVEMTFDDITAQESVTFKRYILSDKCVCIRKTARILNGVIGTSYNGYIEQPGEEWLCADKANEYTKRDIIDKTPLKELVPIGGKLSRIDIEDAQQLYIDRHRDEITFSMTLEEGQLFGQKNIGGGILPDLYLIPAVRDLTDEIRVKTTTTFGRLLSRAVREMAERDPRFIEARKRLEEVVTSLNTRETEEGKSNQLAILEKAIEEDLRSWNVQVEIEVAAPEIERLFELGTDVHLNDGVKTSADRKGNGLQRALMFALLRAWAKALRAEKQTDGEVEVIPRKHSDSVIFAMEEPELFLHPHAQRRLASTLREIAETPEHQVFVCTHSTHFIDLEYYKEIAIITKTCPERGSCIRQCTSELFEGSNIEDRKKRFHMAQWINPDRGEMFFARRVVFVEGETEKVVLPYLAEKMGIFDPDVSIIDCGGKHNLSLYIAVAKAFRISYLVIHDEDPLPNPIPEGYNDNKLQEKQRTFELNKELVNLVKIPLGNLEMLSPEFETVSGVSKSQGDKKGKVLAALAYFENLDKENIPDRLKHIVTAAYGL